MKGIVDRIENKIVVVEINNGYFNFDLEKFPKEIQEGDVVEYKDEFFNILVEEGSMREKKIRTLFDSLLEKED